MKPDRLRFHRWPPALQIVTKRGSVYIGPGLFFSPDTPHDVAHENRGHGPQAWRVLGATLLAFLLLEWPLELVWPATTLLWTGSYAFMVWVLPLLRYEWAPQLSLWWELRVELPGEAQELKERDDWTAYTLLEKASMQVDNRWGDVLSSDDLHIVAGRLLAEYKKIGEAA